ncbi:MAG: hypothetical protein ABJC09_03585 [Terriglobia bacterium]
MKYLPVLMLLALAGGAQTSPRNVYILPMAGGFDQYLAGQIAREHVMQVVTDPKIADTWMTDRLGDAFEANIARIHPAAKGSKDSNSDDKDQMQVNPSFRSSGSRGTIFLVDAASRRVLWSDYQKMSRSSTAHVLNREAAEVTKRLKLFANPSAEARH